MYGSKMGEAMSADQIGRLQAVGLRLFDELIFDPYTQVNGIIMVEDLAGFSLMAMIKINRESRAKMKSGMELMQDCIPLRLGGILVVNEPRYVSVMMFIMKAFMKKKLRERSKLYGRDHKHWKELHDKIGKQNLPVNFDGELTYDYEEYLRIMCERDGSQYVPPKDGEVDHNSVHVTTGVHEDDAEVQAMMEDLNLEEEHNADHSSD
eukprot:comp19818_c0_seq3/m.38367 comp19818_c0_seq3/g.38367  ORF comp19818_c0_seq3/g.38367 comp19818_c0_seq3/m.38367 type:complete len:207 (-) comp19818_c0_seq3:6-626(-)